MVWMHDRKTYADGMDAWQKDYVDGMDECQTVDGMDACQTVDGTDAWQKDCMWMVWM